MMIVTTNAGASRFGPLQGKASDDHHIWRLLAFRTSLSFSLVRDPVIVTLWPGRDAALA